MMIRTRAAAGVAAGAWLVLSASALGSAFGCARQQRGAAPARDELHNEAAVTTTTTATTTMRASGTFEVKLAPQPTANPGEGATLGRMSIDKQFRGDLEATSKGEMLTGMTSVKGSAGYVAIERVTGTLGGRTGTFILQHTGTMTRGAPRLTITVVPDSGTDGLAGLTGTMAIEIAGGTHSYAFDYALAGAP